MKKLIFVMLFSFFLSLYSDTKEEYKIGLVLVNLEDPFYARLNRNAKDYAKDNNITLNVFGLKNGKNQTEDQIAIVEKLIAIDYDAIVIAPVDSAKLIPVCKKALDKGIIVIGIDNPFDKKELEKLDITIPFIGSDNFHGGELLGAYAKKKLEGKGRVLIIEGTRGEGSNDLRKAGFAHEVTKECDIEIVGSKCALGNRNKAFFVVSKFLKKYPYVDAIFCTNDNMALGALRALKSLKLEDKILLFGYGNIKEVHDAMKNNQIAATISEYPDVIGAKEIIMAHKILLGMFVDNHIDIPIELITNDVIGKKIALMLSGSEKDVFFRRIAYSAKKTASCFGMRLSYYFANNSDMQQILDIDYAIKHNSDILIINPTNPLRIVNGIDVAIKAGMKIFALEEQIDRGIISCISSDHIQEGRLAGEFFANKKLRGGIIEITGPPSDPSTELRSRGFSEVVDQCPSLRIVKQVSCEYDREKAFLIMQQILEQQMAFDAIFAHNDKIILGCLDALSHDIIRKHDRRVLVSINANDEVIDLIKCGKISAAISQEPKTLGQCSIKNVVKFISGEDIPKNVLVNVHIIQ